MNYPATVGMERPCIFIGGVRSEFGSFAEAIQELLGPRDIAVEEQLELPQDFGEIAGLLTAKIRRASAAIFLLGETYGSEPISGRDGEPRRSYLQIQYDLARQLDRPVYLFIAEGPDAFDQRSREGDDRRKRQMDFVSDVRRRTGDWRYFTSRSDLLAKVATLPVVVASQRSIGPQMLRSAAPALVGREPALEDLERAWNDPATGVLVVRGNGGLGKTALLAHWIGALRKADWPTVRCKFEWAFETTGTRGQAQTGDGTAAADLFVSAALEFFGDRDPQQGSPFERGSRLAGLVARERSLLVLDGLEPLQQAAGPRQGAIIDPAISALLRGLARANSGLCVVTTRDRITDLAPFVGSSVVDSELPVLPDQAGATLLRMAGVDAWPATLQRLSHEAGGHPLTLQLIGRYVAMAHGGNLQICPPFGFVPTDSEVQGGQAIRVLARIESWLRQGDDVGRRALALLQLLALFDRPASPDCLTVLTRKPPIPGLSDTLNDSEDDLEAATRRLEELGLIVRSTWVPPLVRGFSEEQAQSALRGGVPLPDTPPVGGRKEEPLRHALDCHPVIRERVARRLRQEHLTGWREAHRRLFEHLRSSVPYWPEKLEGLPPLIHAIAHGCKAGLHEEARVSVYRDRLLRGAASGTYLQRIGAIGADLIALGSFFDAPWRRPSPKLVPAEQTWLVARAASALRAAGRVSDAIEPTRAAVDMATEAHDWSTAGSNATLLAELELLVGNVRAAVETGAKAVELGDRSREESLRAWARATQAQALFLAGRLEEALRSFAEAERIGARNAPQTPKLRGAGGFHYCEALLSQAERSAWRAMLELAAPSGNDTAALRAACAAVTQRAEQTLAQATAQQQPLDLALDHLTLARAAFYDDLLQMAETAHTTGARRMPAATRAGDHLAAAVNGLRRAAAGADLPRSLLTRAWLRFVRGDQRSCRQDLEEAAEISAHAPMQLHLVDVHLTRACLFRDRDELTLARSLIDSGGYLGKRPQLEDAELAATRW